MPLLYYIALGAELDADKDIKVERYSGNTYLGFRRNLGLEL